MRICFYGPPGIGKDTISTGIFSRLKKEDCDIEFVSEYVKEWTYIKRQPKPWDQVYLLGKQFHKEHEILEKAGFKNLISSSPLLLTCFYAHHLSCPVTEQLIKIAKEFEKEYPAIHIYLTRESTSSEELLENYDQKARFHDRSEIDEIDRKMKRFLIEHIGQDIFFMHREYDSSIYSIVKSRLD